MKVDGAWVNLPWLAAASLLVARPELLDDVKDTHLREALEGLADRVRAGELPARSHRDVFGPL
jgi:hypothetical protein